MRRARPGAVSLVAAFTALTDAAKSPETNGIAKVLEMLAGMKEKAIKELQDEKVTFAKFSQWCDDTKIELDSAIKKGGTMIDEYTGAIAMNEGKSTELASEIEELAASSAALTEKKNAEVARRAEEASASAKIKAEIQENIIAVGKAIEVLKAEPKSVAFTQTKKEALMQMEQSTAMSSRQKEIVSLLVTGVPAYENQSGGVIKMLEDLMDQFVAEKFKEEKEDSIKAAASDKIVTNLNGQIRLVEEDKTRSEGAKAKHDAAAGKASEDKADAEETLAKNVKNEKQMSATCAKKHADMDVRTQTRTAEIEAIGKAAETIEGVAGLKTAAGLVQQATTSFLQLSANKVFSKQHSSDVDVASLLRTAGQKQHSKRLQLLALKIESLSSVGGPFDKIKKMIEDMIMKLKKESAEEAGKNAQCVQWMSDNKQDMEDSQERLDALKIEIEKQTSTVESSTAKLAELADEAAKAQSTLAKAGKTRAEEKKENAATVADAKVGSEAVDKAIQILNDFYGDAATKTSLVQVKQPEVDMSDMPDTFDSPYTGQQSMGGGVVGIMEVILSDFLKLLQETEAAESAAQKEYDELVQNEAEAKAARDAQMSHLEKTKAKAKADLTQAMGDLETEKSTMSSIVEAKRVIEQDKGCVMGAGKTPDELFKERSDARKAEMESLGQALEVLKVQT
ncbi:unnamed protein product [Amoebophrya sp. A120]|nr:unnamed protein product [Amoebophrya sp. A120]|eukprot:GSA120T00024555001.1